MNYFPPPESEGGWRWLDDADSVRSVAAMDPERLELARQKQEFLYGGDSWAIVIIRRGYLVREFYTFNMLPPTRCDIWSCTKSFTGTAWGILFDDSRNGELPGGQRVDLDSTAYDFIDNGFPLSDERKSKITFRHLLSMTSGIPGEQSGLVGMPTATGQGPYEHALGNVPNRYGYWADRLAADPGRRWDYSDPAFAHLSLAFARIMGREMDEFLQQRIFAPVSIEHLTWDVQGGSGSIGPHTNAHTGIHISARELARFGYLLLNKGRWGEEQLIPEWWLDMAMVASQKLNPAYGYTFWTNAEGAMWPTAPPDAFALMGYRCNKCYVVPSLDLVIARVGTGPSTWEEQGLIGDVIAAIT